MSGTAPLAGRVAMITGAAGGIGRASAVAFARQGAAVMACDVSDAVAATADEILGFGGTALWATVDIGDDEHVGALVRRTTDAFGRLDFAHNNAGVSAAADLADLTPADFERVIHVNVTGTFSCMRHEIPAMLAGGGGVIVNTASIWGLVGAAGKSVYSASKHAVVGLTRSAAQEYGAQGLRVNAIAPGPIDTAMTAAAPPTFMDAVVARTAGNRMGRPEEVAEAVVWLCSPSASYINGVVLPVDAAWLAA